MDTKPNFGERLKHLREHAGLSQQQLANRLGAWRESVARWETGSRAPSWQTVCALAGTLGVEVGAFHGPGKIPEKT